MFASSGSDTSGTTSAGASSDGGGSSGTLDGCDFVGELWRAAAGEGPVDDCGIAHQGDGDSVWQAVHDCIIEHQAASAGFIGGFEVAAVKATGVYEGFFGMVGDVYATGSLELDPSNFDYPGGPAPYVTHTWCDLVEAVSCTPSPTSYSCIQCAFDPAPIASDYECVP